MSDKILVSVIADNLQKELIGSYLSERIEFALSEELTKSKIVIVNISNDVGCLHNIKLKNNNCRILALSNIFSVEVMVKAMRFGADEFLALPLIKSEFFAALDSVKSKLLSAENLNSPCQILSVFSNKGGIGKTSAACNLALELANVSNEKVALVDLNFQMGDVAAFMDVSPAFDITYLVDNINKIDDNFLFNILTKYKHTSLYILADTPYLKGHKTGSVASISKLFDKLKSVFSYIVVDAQSGFDDLNLTVLDMSDVIFLTTVANLPALNNTQRCLDLFERLGYSDKIRILLNRYMENDEITLDDVKTLLNCDIYWKIPNNYFTIMSSINKGIPVCEINSDSNVAKSYVGLALNLYESLYKENLVRR